GGRDEEVSLQAVHSGSGRSWGVPAIVIAGESGKALVPIAVSARFGGEELNPTGGWEHPLVRCAAFVALSSTRDVVRGKCPSPLAQRNFCATDISRFFFFLLVTIEPQIGAEITRRRH
ncbi:MAG: hypothetical protein ACI82G_002542, partial [Bradymonadia bacterium]